MNRVPLAGVQSFRPGPKACCASWEQEVVIDGRRVERLRFCSPTGGPGSIIDLVRSDAHSTARQGDITGAEA